MTMVLLSNLCSEHFSYYQEDKICNLQLLLERKEKKMKKMKTKDSSAVPVSVTLCNTNGGKRLQMFAYFSY